MKRFICLTFALLLTHSDKCNSDLRYYVAIVFQNGQCYEEFMPSPYLEVIAREFVSDSSIESVFFTRDINYVPNSNND